MPAPDVDELIELGRAAGLVAIGVTSAAPFLRVRADLIGRRAEGLHGGMQFTYRNPRRSTDPSRALPGARSLVVGALHYTAGDPPRPERDEPLARVAAYARHDLYRALRAALETMAVPLRRSGHRAVVLADQNDLVDRAVAHRAGIGWWGKSSNILVSGWGSTVVIGSVLTDAHLHGSEPVGSTPDMPGAAGGPVGEGTSQGCGDCTRCLDGCPTGAIVAPGVVDSRLCLAWLVQAEGVFPAEHREALGDRIYGCDECQDVCPPNRVRRRGSSPASGGVVVEADQEAWVSVLDLLVAGDEELLARHGRWYIPRRQARYLRRNALVVLGNVGVGGDRAVSSVVARYLADADPMLRAHAVWCARRLGLPVPARDPHPLVHHELEARVPIRSDLMPEATAG